MCRMRLVPRLTYRCHSCRPKVQYRVGANTKFAAARGVWRMSRDSARQKHLTSKMAGTQRFRGSPAPRPPSICVITRFDGQTVTDKVVDPREKCGDERPN